MTTDVQEPPAPPTEERGRPTWLPWLIAGAAALVAIAIAVGALIAAADNSNDSNTVGTQQLSSIQQACAQWRGGYTGTSTPPSGWCDEMVGWMTNQARSGQMMGSTMWSNPAQMVATCQQWMTSRSTPSGSTPGLSAWCGQMVTWMTQHMGSWDQWDRGWMMDGPMMGR